MEGQSNRQEEMGPFGQVLPPSLQGLGYKMDGDFACFFVEGRQLGELPVTIVEDCFRFVTGARVEARDGGVGIKVPLMAVSDAGRVMSRVWANVGSFGEQFSTGGDGRWTRVGRTQDYAEGGCELLGFRGIGRPLLGFDLSGIRRSLGFVLYGDRDDENSYDGHGC